MAETVQQLLGDTGSAGPTVTGGGLVFVGATSDKRVRAFDSTSGKELWQAKMTAEVNSNPISYGGKSGKLHGGGEGGTRILPAEHRRHDAHMGGRRNRQQFGDALHQAEEGDLGKSQADEAGVNALGADVSHVEPFRRIIVRAIPASQ